MRSARCFRKFEGHKNGVHALQFDTSSLISGGRDGILNIYDLRTGTIRDYIKFESPITSLQFENDSLIFSSERLAPKMFDLASKRDIQDFIGHNGNVRHLHFENGILATASFDGTVKLWSV
jgi:WD40 repeat protein